MSVEERRAKNLRWRCLEVGCNPKLKGHNARQHADDTGHRVARWPNPNTRRRTRQGPKDIPGGDTAPGEEEAMGL